MKKTALIIMLTATLSVVACSSSSSLAGSSSSESAIDREARQYIERHFNAQFKKCGDSYYSHHKLSPEAAAFINKKVGDGHWTQVKDPKIVLESHKLTEADRLNGLEWKGFGYIESGTWRTADDGKWDKWYPSSKHFGEYNPKKKNGEWSPGAWKYAGTATHGDYLVPGDKPDKTKQDPYTFVLIDVDCSKIPQ